MANKLNNLMPIEEVNSRRTREQHSADSKKGGIASGKSRNLTARLKEWAENGGYELMIEKAEEMINEKNARMWEIVRDSIGEKPVEQLNIINTDKSLERLEELFNDEEDDGSGTCKGNKE